MEVQRKMQSRSGGERTKRIKRQKEMGGKKKEEEEKEEEGPGLGDQRTRSIDALLCNVRDHIKGSVLHPYQGFDRF